MGDGMMGRAEVRGNEDVLKPEFFFKSSGF
jgi:hypothetical protein